MNKNYQIFFLLIIGLIIRLILALLPGFRIDMSDWYAWALRLSQFNFASFYSKDLFTDYTPGYLYILSILGFLRNLLNLSDNTFYLLLKIPAVIAEITGGFLVYQHLRKIVSQKLAILAASLILFNPALIFNSSIWGQVDSILALLLLITLLTLKHNLILSSIFFGLAFLIKPQAIALAPVLFLFLIKNFNLINLTKLTVPGIAVIFILTIPFFPHQTITSLVQHILNTANEYPYISLNAYNFWGSFGFWISDKTVWGGLSYQNWGYILLASFWATIAYLYFKKKISIYALAALAALAFFFLPTRVHERYLYPAFIFLTLSAAIFKSHLLILFTTILSLIHLLNLYYVYVYYNEIYFQMPRLFYHPIIYSFLANNSKGLSIFSTIIFIAIVIVILKDDVIPEKA